MLRVRDVVAVSAALSISGLTAYVLYFDYKRRHNVDFRTKLREKARKNAEVSKVQDDNIKKEKLQELEATLRKELAAEPIPTDLPNREASFTFNLQNGQKLVRCNDKEMDTAVAFYRALSVYPNPADLLVIYQKTIPQTIYEYILMMIAINPPENIIGFLKTVRHATQTEAATTAGVE